MFVDRVFGSRAPATCKVATTAILAMVKIPSEQWGIIVNPVFEIYRKAGFLIKERKRVDTVSSKTLKGILRKQYGYKKLVRSIGEEQARREVRKRSTARIEAVIQQVRELDILSLLRGCGYRKLRLAYYTTTYES